MSAAIDPAAQAAHDALWGRFVDRRRGFIHDFAGPAGEISLPTAQESRLGKPNALAWGCPNEDGGLLGGLYMDALANRWRLTGLDEDRGKARLIASGLHTLGTVGTRPGFIARGLCDDASAHHPIGSNDQTSPWLVGMWRAVHSGLLEEPEQRRCTEALRSVGRALRDTAWRIPCDAEPFDWRGDFAEFHWEGASRLLFLCRMMAEIDQRDEWMGLYRGLLEDRDPAGGPSRLEHCRAGMIFWYMDRHSWTSSCGVATLRALWELEEEPALKDAYRQGLCSSAELAATSLPLALEFPNEDNSEFVLDWRVLCETWRPQISVADAVAVATEQICRMDRISPRRALETRLVREPLFAAWIVSLCPDTDTLTAHADAILACLRHYDFRRLYLSQFLMIEAAWYRLRLAGVV